MKTAFTLSLIALCVATATAGTLTAELQQNQISTSDSATIVLTVSGSQISDLKAPEVPGISFSQNGRSTSQRANITNGRLVQSSEVTLQIGVQAAQPGTYTIPAFTAVVDGKKLETEPVVLRVVQGKVQAPNNAPGSFQTPSPPTQRGNGKAPEKLAFLRFELSDLGGRDTLYVGEMIPVEIKVYLHPNTRPQLQTLPKLEGEGFILKGISDKKDEELNASQENLGGQVYHVITWHGALSPIKAGIFPTKLALGVEVDVPNQSRQRRRRRSNSFFGFFNDSFQQRERKEVTLESNERELTVLPLPEEGRPEGFSGAVGDFGITAFELPEEVSTGQPITLRATIGGTGNFGRVEAPLIVTAEPWKNYPAKSAFTPEDSVGFSGSKSFEIPAVAQSPGTEKIGFSFAYFDPNNASYETATTTPVSVTVKGRDLSPERPRSTAQSQDSSPAVAPIKISAGTLGTSLTPLIARPWFLGLQVIPLLAMVAGAVISYLRRRAEDPERIHRQAHETAIRAAIERAAAACHSGDAKTFFTAARKGLQEHFGAEWNSTGSAITSADLSERLPPDSHAHTLFTMADTIDYAGAVNELEDWNRRFSDILNPPDTP